MHFVFEKFVDEEGIALNFVNCDDINPSGIRRFTPCPLYNAIFFLRTRAGPHRDFSKNVTFGTEPIDGKPYIIASGVAHSPDEWCGPDYQGVGANNIYPHRVSVFAHLKESYLRDLQDGKAYLLLDQSHEGYQVDWLWSWFHNNCDQYKINPKQIIYVTGNLDCADQYTAWADKHGLLNRMLPIPYAHFEGMIFETAVNHNKTIINHLLTTFNLPSFKDHLKHKKDNSNIKLYNALQKRPRAHRAWLFNKLFQAGLLDDGINSMNSFSENSTYFENKRMPAEEYASIAKLLPIEPSESPEGSTLETFVSADGGNYLQQFNENIMLDSWLTVISEASFGDSDVTCFISEKSFKPIACSHPFIIAGNRNSLPRLHEMGYKTFHPLIDESYDSLPTWERMDAIISELQRIKAMSHEEKLSWYEQMKPIFKHNHEVFYKNNRVDIHPAIITLNNYVS